MSFDTPLFFDAHVHFRQDAALKMTVPLTARYSRYAVAMPNTNPPISTGDDINRYREEILAAVPAGSEFEPIMAMKILPSTTSDHIEIAAKCGAKLAKLYPAGSTTNSQDAVRMYELTDQGWWSNILSALAANDMILSIHAEDPRVESSRREKVFLENISIRDWLMNHPKLKIVIEHLTTAYGVYSVVAWDYDFKGRIAGTITLHHLVMTEDDAWGDGVRPHNCCRPPAKLREDRSRLQSAVKDCADDLRQCFFLGSDSAPHPIAAKNSDCCANGCFTSPHLPERLANIMSDILPSDKNFVKAFTRFTSENGRRFYGLPTNDKKKLRFTKLVSPELVNLSDQMDQANVAYRVWHPADPETCWTCAVTSAPAVALPGTHYVRFTTRDRTSNLCIGPFAGTVELQGNRLVIGGEMVAASQNGYWQPSDGQVSYPFLVIESDEDSPEKGVS